MNKLQRNIFEFAFGMHTKTVELFKYAFVQGDIFLLMRESIAARTPKLVELRLADTMVEAFAKSYRPSVSK